MNIDDDEANDDHDYHDAHDVDERW